MCIVNREETREPEFDGLTVLANTGFLIRNNLSKGCEYQLPLSINVTPERAFQRFLKIINDCEVNSDVKDTLKLYKKIENDEGSVDWNLIVVCRIVAGKKRLVGPDGKRIF